MAMNGRILGIGALGVALLLGAAWVAMLVAGSDEPETAPGDVPTNVGGAGNPGKKPRTKPLEVVPEVDPVARDDRPKISEPIAVSSEPAFEFEGYEKGLAAIDWNVLAAQLFDLSRRLPQLAVAISSGREFDTKLLEDARSALRALHERLASSRDDFPAAIPIGIIAHPAVSANAIARTLEATGVPLSEDQAAKLRALTEDYLARDAQRIKATKRDTLWLRAAADEAELRAEFVTRARALLSREQGAAVGSGPYAHRVALDAFSPALDFRETLIPLLRSDADHDVHMAMGHVVGGFGMPDEERLRQIEGVVRAWAGTIPDQAFTHRPGRISTAGFVELKEALRAARLTSDLYERVIAEVHPTTGQVLMLTNNHMMFSPTAE